MICRAREHQWDEGDNGAIYCGRCHGYACDECAGSGHDEAGRGCFACSRYGVVMWFEPEQRFISPLNVPGTHSAPAERGR